MNEKSIDLLKILRFLLMQSKMIIAIVFIATASSVAYFFLAEKNYEISSLVQIQPEKSQFPQDMLMDFYLSNSESGGVNSFRSIYTSRSIMLDVIKTHNIHISSPDLSYMDKKIFVELDLFSNFYEELSITFNNSNFEIMDSGNIIVSAAYNTPFENTLISGLITKPENEKLFQKKINFTYKNPSIVYKGFINRFQISSSAPFGRNTDISGEVFKISFTTYDPIEGINVLNYTNESYLASGILAESEEATKAIEFLDSRISTIEKELKIEKEQLRQFQESTNSINVDLETQSLILSLAEVQKMINEVDIKINTASNSYTESNRIYLDLIDQRETLIKQKNNINNDIKKLPLAQQEYISLLRGVERTEEIFSNLVAKRLEFSIKEASTLGSIRIIDVGYVSGVLSPKSSLVLLSFMLSIIISGLVAILRGMYFLPITNPAELTEITDSIGILGVVPNFDEENSTEIDDDRLSHGIDSILLGIDKLYEDKNYDKKILSLTSATPKNGKSSLSRLCAQRLAELGNKTLLIDADFKRGDQHEAFDVKKISEKSFYKLSKDRLNKIKVSENLYLIPKITKLSNSFQLIYNDKYEEKIMELSKEFDYIVFDTAPILSVSDTSAILGLSNLNLFILRHNLTKSSEIHQSIKLFNQMGLNPDGFIYNDYKKPQGYYGYYGLYGNYEYQYYANKYLYDSYDYENNN